VGEQQAGGKKQLLDVSSRIFAWMLAPLTYLCPHCHHGFRFCLQAGIHCLCSFSFLFFQVLLMHSLSLALTLLLLRHDGHGNVPGHASASLQACPNEKGVHMDVADLYNSQLSGLLLARSSFCVVVPITTVEVTFHFQNDKD